MMTKDYDVEQFFSKNFIKYIILVYDLGIPRTRATKSF